MMKKIRIVGRIRNLFGEEKEVEAIFVPIREVGTKELIERAERKGMFYPVPPKPVIMYDVWINGKKITRGSKKFIKEKGTIPSLSDVVNVEYYWILSEKVEQNEI
jgi:hypothetical protein